MTIRDQSLATGIRRLGGPRNGFRYRRADGLVRMKLTSFRDQDRVHLRDLLDVRLVDASFCTRLAGPLAQRLRQLLDNPE